MSRTDLARIKLQAFNKAITQLQSLPPLISTGEVAELRKQLAEVAQGKRFLLQVSSTICQLRYQGLTSRRAETALRDSSTAGQ